MNKKIFIIFFLSLTIFTGCAKDEYGKNIDTKNSLKSAEYTENYKLYIYFRNSSGYEVASKYLEPLLIKTSISQPVINDIKNDLKLDKLKLKQLNKQYIENYYKKLDKEYQKNSDDKTNDEFSKINVEDSIKQIDENIITITKIFDLVEKDIELAENGIIDNDENKKIISDQIKIIQLNSEMIN